MWGRLFRWVVSERNAWNLSRSRGVHDLVDVLGLAMAAKPERAEIEQATPAGRRSRTRNGYGFGQQYLAAMRSAHDACGAIDVVPKKSSSRCSATPAATRIALEGRSRQSRRDRDG
jgi:hypothetical protein